MIVLLTKSKATLRVQLSEVVDGVVTKPNIATSSTVKLWLKYGDTIYAGPFTCVHTTTGAVWATGLIICEIAHGVTTAWLKKSPLSVEVEVTTDGVPDKWPSTPVISVELGA